MARFRVVTKPQISGWRFLLHRIEHALVRRDASMMDDPQRGRSTALMIGVAVACIGLAGAAALAFFKPAKSVGDAKIIADKDSGALYVRIEGRLHPALNLTSARLILGSADNPKQVGSDKIRDFARGPWVGIPGAPGRIVDSGDPDSNWTICDTAKRGASAPIHPVTGLPTLLRSAVNTTAIGGPLTTDDPNTRQLNGHQARLMRGKDTTWLVYADGERGMVRAAIDLTDSAVMLALGIDATAPVVAASPGLLQAIPEASSIAVPKVPGRGNTVTLKPNTKAKVGSVLTVSVPGREAQYYLVSRSGVVRISSVLAAMVRNDKSYGTASNTVSPDVISANLISGEWPGTQSFPIEPVDLVDPDNIPVTCYHWSLAGHEPKPATEILVGKRLPLTKKEQSSVVYLVTAPASGGRTADTVYMPHNSGSFVQVTGADHDSPREEGLFWISDSGVRYGIGTTPGEEVGDSPAVKALGLKTPIKAPWSIVSLFAVGPMLSPEDARIQHDGIPPNLLGTSLQGGSS